MFLQKFLLRIGYETKTPQEVLQLLSKIKKLPFRSQVTYQIYSILKIFGTRCFLWAALQTMLKTKSLQCIFDILKVAICKTNSEHRFYLPLVLLVSLIVHNAL